MGFVEPLKDISVPEKKQAKFQCTVTKEVPKVMWFRGAEIITPGPKYEIIDDGLKHMLIINCCEFDDEAQYTVEVLGDKSHAQLMVEGKCQATCFLFVALMWLQPAMFVYTHLMYCRREAEVCAAASRSNGKRR